MAVQRGHLVGASGSIYSNGRIGNGTGRGQGAWVIRKLPVRNVGDCPGENVRFRFFIDDAQNALVQGDFHVVKQTVKTGMVGPESNPDWVIVCRHCTYEEGPRVWSEVWQWLPANRFRFFEVFPDRNCQRPCPGSSTSAALATTAFAKGFMLAVPGPSAKDCNVCLSPSELPAARSMNGPSHVRNIEGERAIAADDGLLFPGRVRGIFDGCFPRQRSRQSPLHRLLPRKKRPGFPPAAAAGKHETTDQKA